MIDFSEAHLILNGLGGDIRTYLSTTYPWLPVAVVAAFSLANSVRVLAYVPQILKTARDENGATAISFVTWGLFFLSHLTTIAYAVVHLGDLVMALIFFGNAFACLLILVIASAKRKRHQKALEKSNF
jgi:Flp pilus assembly protein TadB